jgi:hypothetical protein
VAEQAYAQKKAAKAQQAAEIASAADNAVPAPPAPSAHVEKEAVAAPLPPAALAPLSQKENVSEGKKAPSAAALADYYVRKPLAPTDNYNAPSARQYQQQDAAAPRKAGDYRHIESRYAQYNRPSQKAAAAKAGQQGEGDAINRPRIPYSHGQYGQAPRVAGHAPARAQYQHRMW